MRLVQEILEQDKIFIEGAMGSGKTHTIAELCRLLGSAGLLGPRKHSIMLLTGDKREQIEQMKRICQAIDQTLNEAERGTW